MAVKQWREQWIISGQTRDMYSELAKHRAKHCQWQANERAIHAGLSAESYVYCKCQIQGDVYGRGIVFVDCYLEVTF